MDKTIWIVSDDSHLRQKLPGLLEPLGYAHRLFKLPKSALRTLAREDAPALIVVDTTALEMLSRLREAPRNVHLPVIVITSEANEGTVENLLRLGADGCINKPVTAAALEKAIQAAIQRRRGVA